jgi:hypothetical protein
MSWLIEWNLRSVNVAGKFRMGPENSQSTECDSVFEVVRIAV